MKLQVIDTAGQSEYTPALPNRYNIGVHGYLLVFSINDNMSFETVQHINKILLEGIGSKYVPRILVGNKTDLESEREVSIERIKKLSKSLKCPYVECSAKEGGEGIEKIFYKLLKEIEKESNDEYPYDIKSSTGKINFIRKHYKKFHLLLLLLVSLLILLGIVSFITSIIYIFIDYITIDAFVITSLVFSFMLLLTNFRSMRLIVKKLYQFMPSINAWTYATLILNLVVIVLININTLISIKVIQYFEHFNPMFVYFLTFFFQIAVVVVNKNLEPLYEELSSMSPINQHLLIKI